MGHRMSRIDGRSLSEVDFRVDGIIAAHHDQEKERQALQQTIGSLREDFASWQATVTEHLTNHPAPATQEMPAPQVITHRHDVHHRYIEKISDEEQARIEQSLHTAQRAMEQADYALGQAVLTSQMYERLVDEKQQQINDLQRDVAVNAARHSNDIGAVQEEFKQLLNRAYWVFGLAFGVALVLGIYSAL